MNELAWMNNHKLSRMTEEQLGHARRRFNRHCPRCMCGNSLTHHVDSRQVLCEECGRLYVPTRDGKAILGRRSTSISETVRVVFDGDITTKTFNWEL